MPDFSRIEAVLFDVGQTFLYPDFPFLKNLLAEYDVSTEFETLNKGAAAAREKTFRHREQENWKEYFTHWMQLAGAPEQKIPEILQRIFERHQREHFWNWLDPIAPEVFDQLKNFGYRLGVISNSDGSIAAAMKKFGLAKFFDCILDSRVVGVEKPNPKIFAMALQLLNLSAEKCVYVGDNYDRDVIGARGVGITPILLDPFEVVAERDVIRIKKLGELAGVLKKQASSQNNPN